MFVNRLKHQNDLVKDKKKDNIFVIILYLLLCLILSISFYQNIKSLLSSRNELNSAREMLERESSLLVSNQERLNKVNSNLYVEDVARDTLGLSKEGELVIVFPNDDDLKKLSPRLFEKKNIAKEPTTPMSQKWAKLLF